GEVRRHCGGASRVVGDDVFAVLADELSTGPGDAQWCGYLGYASRRDLPPRPDPRMPDAVWMRPSVVRSFAHEVAGSTPPTTAQPPAPPVPDSCAAAFARVQEELRAGNTYEVNLTHRVTATSALTPAQAYAR